MALSQHEVRRSASIPASADQVWSIVRDFCGVWHPAIESMTSEYDDQGGLIRAFTLAGDPTTYRERLTWYSDSKRSMAYTHIDGIAGADSYTARLFVTPDPEPLNVSCTVTLSARLTAAEPRASEIAAGTKFIFDDAIAVIKTLATSATSQTEDPALTISNPLGQIRTHRIDGTPSLTISFCDGPDKTNDTLCLFLHGIGGNRSNWSQQLNAVALLCNVAALDLRGYGDSALGDKPSTIEDYCTDILRVAESLGAKKLILCGLSYGAWIATSFATHHADRLAALVLSGGCTGMSEADKEERDTFRNSREVPLAQGQTPADFAPAVVSVLAGPDITDLSLIHI